MADPHDDLDQMHADYEAADQAEYEQYMAALDTAHSALSPLAYQGTWICQHCDAENGPSYPSCLACGVHRDA